MSGTLHALVSGMNSRKLDVVIRPQDGGEYSVWAVAQPRDDGRWQGLLEFRAEGGEALLRTPVQTTQQSENGVYYWAAGLSLAHIEYAFRSVAAPQKVGPAGVSAAATAARPNDRLRQLEFIERDVLSFFTSRGLTRVRTQEIFDRGPHANADFVRAFERLEKQDGLLVRRTIDGVDWLELTMEGARALGLPATPGEKAIREPAEPER